MCPYGCRGIEGDRSDAAFALLAEIRAEAERGGSDKWHSALGFRLNIYALTMLAWQRIDAGSVAEMRGPE